MSTMPAKEIHILASGELGDAERQAAFVLLGRLGLSVQVVDANFFPSPGSHEAHEIADEGPPYSFGEITDRDQYLGIDHIEQFRRIYLGHLDKRVVTWTFDTLVKPRVSTWRRREEGPLTPKDLGLVVKKRADVDFPPLSRQFIPDYQRALYARHPERFHKENSVTQVGGVIDFVHSIDTAREHFCGSAHDGWYVKGVGEQRKDFLNALVDRLQAQIENS